MERPIKKVFFKKKRGRPATGRQPIYSFRLPEDLVARADEWAKAKDYKNRSSAIRAMIERALKD